MTNEYSLALDIVAKKKKSQALIALDKWIRGKMAYYYDGPSETMLTKDELIKVVEWYIL